MKTNHYVEMPYCFNSNRLSDLETGIKKQVREESRDYIRIAIPFRRRFWRIFRVPSIFTYYQKENNRLVNELHSATASIQSNIETFQNVRFSYLELTALPTDKNYLLYLESEKRKEETSHAIYVSKSATQLVNGARYEALVLREQQQLHKQQLQHIESEKQVQVAKNNTINAQLENYRNFDLLEKATENGTNTWENFQDVNQKQHDLTPIPDTGNQSETRNISLETIHKMVDKDDTVVNHESRFIPLENNLDQKAFPYRNDLPMYLNGECQFTLAMDHYSKTYTSIHFPKDCPENDIALFDTESHTSESLYLPNVKQNMLGGASLWFTVFLFLCCIGVMLYEGTLFQQVLTELFQLSGFKVWFALFIPLIIAETISILQYGLIKKMIRRQTLNWRGVITSRYFIVLLVGLICITSCLGILYYHSLSQKQGIKELTVLANDVSKLQNQQMLDEKFDDQKKLSDLEQEYELKRKIIFEKPPFMEAMKMTILALISGFFLLASSLCLSITMLCFKSILLRRKIARIRKQNSRSISKTHQIRTTLRTLREKGYYITSLKAKIVFLKSLQNGSVPASAIHSPSTKDEYPLPLNDKAV